MAPAEAELGDDHAEGQAAGLGEQQDAAALPGGSGAHGHRTEDAAPLPDRGKTLSEREVLRVLWNSPDRHLVRAEIHRRLNPVHRLTQGRIGQILADLFKDGLLDRTQARSQGASKASFYALSPLGRALCRQLGFERQEETLFHVAEADLKRYLVAERLARQNEKPGRIVVFHAPRRGIGQSTTVASAALLLATHFKQPRRLLVVDFDLQAAGLDAHLAPLGLCGCRGLRGLVVDFYSLPDAERQRWLPQALKRSEYVIEIPETPNLFYMPSGFAAELAPASSAERTEALDRLWDEATLRSDQTATGNDQAGLAETSFLSQLRNTLLDAFDHIVVDSQTGPSLGAWAAVRLLADDLVVCLPSTDEPGDTVRNVVANFLGGQELSGRSAPGVAFVFGPSKTSVEKKSLLTWVERHVLNSEEAEGELSAKYRTLALRYNWRVAEGSGREPDLVKTYGPLLPLLTNIEEIQELKYERPESIPMGMRFLIGELRPKFNIQDKEKLGILTGALASALGERGWASKLKASTIKEELDPEIVGMADGTEKIMVNPKVRIYR